jgi:hypothetical protein
VDIPDPTTTNPRFGTLSNPKTWTGPWVTITQPTEIANIVSDINTAQYHQAHNTPFGSGHLANTLGRHGDTPQAVQLLKGVIPEIDSKNTLPETLCILHSLSQPSKPMEEFNWLMTPEEFISTYRVTPENKSTSP